MDYIKALFYISTPLLLINIYNFTNYDLLILFLIFSYCLFSKLYIIFKIHIMDINMNLSLNQMYYIISYIFFCSPLCLYLLLVNIGLYSFYTVNISDCNIFNFNNCLINGLATVYLVVLVGLGFFGVWVVIRSVGDLIRYYSIQFYNEQNE
jgi:hypothetical protein